MTTHEKARLLHLKEASQSALQTVADVRAKTLEVAAESREAVLRSQVEIKRSRMVLRRVEKSFLP